LYRLHEAGTAQKEIAVLMNRSESTISRELRRNCLPKGGYKPASADRIALSRRRRCSKLERLNPLGTLVRDRLAMGWSPEQIAGRLRLEGSEHRISHESIYRFIYRPKIRPEKLHRYLARAKARRGRRYFKHRREPIKNRRSIHQRPRAVEKRAEFGHWEGDLMQFRSQRGNLLTACERKTRFLITAPLQSKTALETGQVLRDIFHRLPEAAKRTITFDNGGEFAEHEKLEKHAGVLAFFCDPHSPWQRGAIENANGIIRRDMPRKTDITEYSTTDIDDIMWAINSTPRKCLGYQTPAEAFIENLRIALEM
ncbi:MAG: IS30 family transposase, partial [Alphaproteobacteria bacterium]|nr:IS30 family transposase [Alphaproteobacteria bacterium]